MKYSNILENVRILKNAHLTQEFYKTSKRVKEYLEKAKRKVEKLIKKPPVVELLLAAHYGASKIMTENEGLKYIGVKDLGSLALSDFCPRCFWFERHFGPFPIFFPGIFNVIDRNLKNSAWLRWKKERKLPSWLKIDDVKRILTADKVGKVEERYRQKYLVAHHKKTGFILRGAPDLILELKDNSLHLIDFKTSRFKEGGDQFFPVYEAQLNGYALLATKIPASKLSLVYFNPINEISTEILTESNFKLAFEPKIVPVEIKSRLVLELLMKAKEILDLKTPPPAREGCRGTCFYINRIIPTNQLLR